MGMVWVWYGMVWYGMVWYGMVYVWYGLVWYGMVWHAVVVRLFRNQLKALPAAAGVSNRASPAPT